MNLSEIEQNLESLIASFSEESFIFGFLLACGMPNSTISLLKKGKRNLSKIDGHILLQRKLYFAPVRWEEDVHAKIHTLMWDDSILRHKPRFIIVTDYRTLLAYDTKTKRTLDIDMQELPKYADFFLPWVRVERDKKHEESPVDRDAAYKMAKLYDAIRDDKDNDIRTPEAIHALNVFLARILFCFFAEDTGIFPKDIFTRSIESHTQVDGSDMAEYLRKVFETLDTKEDIRWSIAHYLDAFPYANGGFFRERYPIPTFHAQSRRILIECGYLNWSAINPDIFGSMIQAVTDPSKRTGLGMHYTSVPNIMKVILPLFLSEIKQEYETNRDSVRRLQSLLVRMGKIRVFDPACGSGNFLIIAYKELRRLEMDILDALYQSDKLTLPISHIDLSHFSGIEIDDFAHEIAGLSLYLAKYQMDTEFKARFGDTKQNFLPLTSGGHIVRANATRIDWEEVCPREEEGGEVYILGNPPYLWARNQGTEQKEDMKGIFKKDYNNLDYIACWFLKVADYIRKVGGKCAFVSTNSICQGEQVALLWPRVLGDDLEIGFAHQSFKWENNAKRNAGVTVVIVSIRKKSKEPKSIHSDTSMSNTNMSVVENITPYLTEGAIAYVQSRGKPLSNLPKMCFGNMPNDGGNLILDKHEKDAIIRDYPESQKFFKRLLGSLEFIRGTERWCLWIWNTELQEAQEIPPIKKRIEKVQIHRLSSVDAWTRNLAIRPHQFRDLNCCQHSESIIIPRHSSERRDFIPLGFVDKTTIVMDSAMVVYNAEPWIFGVLTSRMHMVWVRAVAGRLKTDYRYSAQLCYNTFPIPALSSNQREAITSNVYNVITERERYPERTMAELYDPDRMPSGLREAHRLLDELIDKCYRMTPFRSDTERLAYLFALYERMIEAETATKKTKS